MKFPFIQFYVKDYLGDEKLSRCSLLTRGLWIELLFAMHLADRCGLISATRPELARIGRCTIDEVALGMDELLRTGAADVTERDGVVTVINRRMRKEHNTRKQTALRVQEFRSNESVTEKKPPRACVASDCGYGSDSSPPDGKGYGGGKVSDGPPAPPPPSDLRLKARFGAMFRRREATKWSEPEIKKLRSVEELGLTEDDIALLERWYGSKCTYLRRDLMTFLNNILGEIDRARDWFLNPDTNFAKPSSFAESHTIRHSEAYDRMEIARVRPRLQEEGA